MMKRKLILLMCIMSILIVEVPVCASGGSSMDMSVNTVLNSNEVKINQTKWYYRTYNGREQKRLWSITEGKWLTDWMDIN